MFDFKFQRRKTTLIVIAYSSFCAAVVSAFFWIENLLWDTVPVPRLFGFISMMTVIRWGIMFLMGLPFIILSHKQRIDLEKNVPRVDVLKFYDRSFHVDSKSA